jgi:hypothetical protein
VTARDAQFLGGSNEPQQVARADGSSAARRVRERLGKRPAASARRSATPLGVRGSHSAK